MTLLRLVLIRHAKSDHGAAVPDHERSLNGRGRRDAPRMAAWVAEGGYVPDEVICSDAQRTRETLDLMLPAWSPAPSVRHEADLYHADPESALGVIASARGRTVAVVGHNPGIGLLAAQLAARAPDHPRWVDFPTAAVAVMAFEAEVWDGIEEGAGDLLAFAVPADLG